MLGANSGATFCYIAVADSLRFSEFRDAIFNIERMHLQRRCIYQKTRPYKFIVEMMLPKNMADILAEKTFDALAKFLNPLDITL